MKQLLKQVSLAVAACGLFVAPVLATGTNFPVICPVGQIATRGVCAQPTPDQGLKLLLEGNRNFAKGNLLHLAVLSNPAVRKVLALGQHPYAVVLTCSDSRLPAEILFDKGLGEIFTVRVAGNVVAPHELGSIEYAIEHLGANLVVVLGHERCGAVKATYDTYPGEGEGNIGSLVKDIYPAVEAVLGGNPKPTGTAEKAAQVEECIVENIKLVSESLEAKSPIIKEYKELGKIKIFRAKYDLDDGIVRVLGE
ncbi:MAG: carbonic anhydrase [Steroidobacteraceae bacterium]|nr:carbonic anhydrase [Deltaproteobacteria bacterium]